jgi:hypothetical protein
MTIIKIWILVNMLVFALSLCEAGAQSQPSPSQTALQIDNVVNQWAQQLEMINALLMTYASSLKKQKPQNVNQRRISNHG